ncbi:MAG: NAD-dependent protein deacylase [Candidatus Lokiarchaeota archaeon]|nr:NAD-dependent protein deacylase [Candidatus Harpocratesius repetitus]
MGEYFDPQISIAIDLLRYSNKIVAFTGAGISTASGIDDFRSPGGLWTQFNPLKYANYSVFLKTPKYYWQLEKALIPKFENAKPNKAHKALVSLEKKGKLKAIITQNIDNFHQDAGSKVPIVELHGNMNHAYCMDCYTPIKRNYILKWLKRKSGIPICPKCGGRIKTNIVLFNEPIAEDLLEEATKYAEDCEIMLVLGSSLTVFPANQIPLLARKAGAKLIFINKDPTFMDKYATLRMLGNLETYLPMIINSI